MLFKRTQSYSLVKVERDEAKSSVKRTIDKIHSIDKEIEITSKAIIQAQAVRMRSFFAKDNNLLIGLQKKFTESTAATSAQWHQKQLIELYQERRELQFHLDRLTGNAWKRRLITWFRLFLGFMGISLIIFILFMGLIAAIYLLPIFAMIVIILFIVNKRQ
ncbi:MULTISPECIES: hypothetical protein [unclassified Prochlorococcus]|uniref:hypothetical protein n=1 Tax=unclassified Prochlorococcus TaxID=2627481 RepID=UPI0012679724|nr:MULTISPECIES: hypothetical protein [unclassified Prochlorococcus]